MGLGDFTDDGDSKKSSGNNRQYVRPDRHDFEEFFQQRSENWAKVNVSWTKEETYTTPDFAPDLDDVGLMCYTTVHEETGVAREKGADAIRLVAVTPDGKPVAGERKTLRIKTWRKNLNKKIDSMIEQGKELVKICPQCDSLLERREGEYGEFYGCRNYPDCDYTEDT